MPLVDAYRVSARKLREFIEIVYSKGIPACTVSISNKRNLGRLPQELSAISLGIEYLITSEIPEITRIWKTDVIVVGDKTLLSQPSMTAIESQRSPKANTRLYLLIWYSSSEELQRACEQRFDVHKPLANFCMPETVDLVIRTGGAKTLSDFVPVQSAYARLVFLDNLFNDLEAFEFEQIIDSILSEQFRYGV